LKSLQLTQKSEFKVGSKEGMVIEEISAIRKAANYFVLGQ
jgi:hypothetical protein